MPQNTYFKAIVLNFEGPHNIVNYCKHIRAAIFFLLFQLLIIFSINLLIVWFIKHQKRVKNVCHYFLSSEVLFCLTNSPRP